MSWNPPPNGHPHHPNEWSNEEDDHEQPGGQSSEEEEIDHHHHRYPEHPPAVRLLQPPPPNPPLLFPSFLPTNIYRILITHIHNTLTLITLSITLSILSILSNPLLRTKTTIQITPCLTPKCTRSGSRPISWQDFNNRLLAKERQLPVDIAEDAR